MKLGFVVLVLLFPAVGLAQVRHISEPSYWKVIRDADALAETLQYRKVTKNETLSAGKIELSKKDVLEHLPPDRERFTRTTYEGGKVSTFELIKVGSDHYCRKQGGTWLKSNVWCGPSEMYGDPTSTDTAITLEVVGSDKDKVEHYRYRSTFVFGENRATHFSESNTWIDAEKRVIRSETRRGIVDSDGPIFIFSEDYEYGPFRPLLDIKAPTKGIGHPKK